MRPTRKRNFFIIAISTLVCLADVDVASAQFQGYPAYGSLRGRARTVVRGDVVRSRVHWGGGVSPQFAGIMTSPAFWDGVNSVAGTIGPFVRSDDQVYVTQEELNAIRAQRAAERSEHQRQDDCRATSEKSIREILALNDEMIRRLSGGVPVAQGVSAGGSGLDARTQRFLEDAKEIHNSSGASSKLAPALTEGKDLSRRYSEIQKAIQETNAALEALSKARGGT